MKFLSIDLETTGLNPNPILDENGKIVFHANQIIEVGVVLEDTNTVLPLESLPK